MKEDVVNDNGFISKAFFKFQRREELSEEDFELLKAFIGPNYKAFIDLIESNKGFAFNFAAGLLPLVWFMYRRLYLVGFLFFATFMILGEILPGEVSTSTFVIMGLYGNNMYVWHAKRKIKKLKKQNLSHPELLQKAAKAGGTFAFGAVGGIVICFGLLGSLMADEVLPACDSPVVQKQVKEMVGQSLEGTPLKSEMFSMIDFQRVESMEGGDIKICQCKIVDKDSDDSFITYYFSMTFDDSTKKMLFTGHGQLDAVRKKTLNDYNACAGK